MRTVLVLIASLIIPVGAGAQTVAKTYSYFGVAGGTLDEIQGELDRRGPTVGAAGKRHPGATRMQFTTSVSYAKGATACSIAKAAVTVNAEVILPRWRGRRNADAGVALVWDTLSADIKRHEESHVSIAKSHARELQDALISLRPRKECDALKAEVAAVGAKILKRHDKAQDRFDMVEGRNFQARIARLLEYRMQRLSGQKAGG